MKKGVRAFCAGILLLGVLLVFSSCTDSPVRYGLVLLPGDKQDYMFELHVVMHHRSTKRSAILVIPGETQTDDHMRLGALAASDPERAENVVEQLLDISLSCTVPLEGEDALALFAILDSLSDQTDSVQSEENLARVYTRRWDSLYRHAAVLASDEISDTVLAVTEGYAADRRVLDFLNDVDGKPLHLVPYPIDMNQKPLYDGAYGKELTGDIREELGRNDE
ncbi:MAG: hypothetical protein ACQEQU_01340 [Spirochaetota bacterium]